MDKSNIKIAVLGGDARQNAAADYLAKKGYTVTTWGLAFTPEFAVVCQTPEEALHHANILLLPLPLTRDRLQLNGTDLAICNLLSLLQAGTQVFCGMPNEDFVREAKQRGIFVTDYSRDEIFMIRNAQPTAEGAVAIAMNEMHRTLFGSAALIVGYGRIGKLLADLLIRMGVQVTIAARKQSDLAVATLHGCQTLQIPNDAKGEGRAFPLLTVPYHVIFNTVPALLLDKRVLHSLHRDTILIDLASAPGGIDYDAANRMGLKTVIALALPGKVAPITAGEIIGDCILAHREGGNISP